jgi:pSer/pThr/pTyr-binding forkhead associated (FHA) protein
VSRHHAEFIVNSANDLVLVDCESKFGTFVRSGSDWRRITTARVKLDDQIRLGEYQTSIKAIMAAVAAQLPAAQAPPSPPPAKPSAPPERRTIVERDPETGEIITRKER